MNNFDLVKLSLIVTSWYLAGSWLWAYERECWMGENVEYPFIYGPYLIPLIISFMALTWYFFLELITRRADKWFTTSVEFMGEVGSFIYLITWSFGYQEEFPRCSIANSMLYISFLLVFLWVLVTIARAIPILFTVMIKI